MQHLDEETKVFDFLSCVKFRASSFPGPSIKPRTWNIPERTGTFRNTPERGIIIIIMRKTCQNKVWKIELNKNKLVSSRKLKLKKRKETKQKHKKLERKKKMTAMSEGSQLKRLSNSFLSYKLLVFGHRSLIKNVQQTVVINILKTFIL